MGDEDLDLSLENLHISNMNHLKTILRSENKFVIQNSLLKSGRDILQEMILQNIPEVVYLILQNSLFQSKDFPLNQCSNYIFLAARLGRLNIAQLIVSFKGFDPYDCGCTCLVDSYERKNNSQCVVTQLDHQPKYSAIDWSAKFGHVRLIFYLTEQYSLSKQSNFNTLETCIDINTDITLDFLLSLKDASYYFPHLQKQEALKLAILKKRTCITSFLKHKIYPESNCLSYLLLYSDGFSDDIRNSYDNVPQITQILLNYGAEVNYKDQTGCFPLYCLLSSFVNWINAKMSYFSTNHFKTLTILLENGADCNFSEIDRFTDIHGHDAVYFGRDLWSSALFSFLIQIENLEESELPRVIELLISYGANPYYSYHLGILPIRALFIEIDQNTTDCCYDELMLRKYFEIFSRVMNRKDFSQELLKIKQIIEDNKFKSSNDRVLDEDVYLFDASSYYTEVVSLQHTAKLVIWSSCQWKVNYVKSLVTSANVLKILMNLVN